MNQEQYDVLLSYLRTAKLPSTLTKNEKDSFRRKWRAFWWRMDCCSYHRDGKSNVDQQVWYAINTIYISYSATAVV